MKPPLTRIIHVTPIHPYEYESYSLFRFIPRLSYVTLLFVLVITCILMIPSSTATSHLNHSTCPSEHPTWHPIQQPSQSEPNVARYMIMFNHYALQQYHADMITSHLTTPYTHIPRDNAASTYPTDFIVAMLTPVQVESIRTLHTVKYVVIDKTIRSLLSIEDDMLHDVIELEMEHPEDPSTYIPPFDVPRRFSSHNAFFDGDDEDEQQQQHHPHEQQVHHARKLCQATSDSITEKLGASTLWAAGHTGKHVSIAIFDTGLSTTHPHFKKIKDRTNWTDEKTLEDGLGHGTFVAGVIASMRECLGFAPDADLHIFRVFTQRQLSYTSWFMDAFNHAIHTHIDVLNLSIGGPDFMDRPFVDKVLEMSANHIIVVSAIGNDGPLYGTLNNPADQMDVIGVGGIDGDDRIARFSSRGMTTWELPEGYGRVKPDIVTYGKNIRGSKLVSGCRSLSGTSVASPVVAGAVVALVSVVPKEERALRINPASVKQLLVESAQRIPEANIFEQGMGKLNLEGAYRLLTSGKFEAHISLIPPTLDLTDCPYMWPYCTQEIYYTGQPIIVNVTLLNSISVSASFLETPKWMPSDHDVLDITFTYSSLIWPWSGWLGIHIRVKQQVSEHMIVNGHIKITIKDEYGKPSSIETPLTVAVIPTPPRSQRVLWDQFHNLRYPSGYFPRDNLDITSDILDWNGDHPHTNFRDVFIWMRLHGYYLEILGQDFTCFDANHYGALLMIDPEEEYFDAEVTKLYHDIMEKGLSLILFADWYNVHRMREVKFFDENTARWWMPETGGSNLPAINELLSPYGIAFGDQIWRGNVNINGEEIAYASGTSILRFPADSYLLSSFLQDSTTEASSRTNTRAMIPILGAWHSNTTTSGQIIVYGDSNCLDMNHRDREPCIGLFNNMLLYATTGNLPDGIKNFSHHMIHPFHAELPIKQPERMIGNGLARYSRVISYGSRPQCLSRATPTPPSYEGLSNDLEVDPMMARSRAIPASASYSDLDTLHSRGPTLHPFNETSVLSSFPTSPTDTSMIVFIILIILICGLLFAARQLYHTGVVTQPLSSTRRKLVPGSGRRSGSVKIGMEP